MTKSLKVANIRCEGCAQSIKNALEGLELSNIEVDLSCEPRKVTFETKNEAVVAQVIEILRKLGYPLADEKVGFTSSSMLKAKSFVSCAVGKIDIKKGKSPSY